jgi:hypothetical protein
MFYVLLSRVIKGLKSLSGEIISEKEESFVLPVAMRRPRKGRCVRCLRTACDRDKGSLPHLTLQVLETESIFLICKHKSWPKTLPPLR